MKWGCKRRILGRGGWIRGERGGMLRWMGREWDIGEGSQVKGKKVGWRGKTWDEEPRKGKNFGVSTKGVGYIGRKLSKGREIGVKVKELGLKGEEVGLKAVRWKGMKWTKVMDVGLKGTEVGWRGKQLGEKEGSGVKGKEVGVHW